MAQVAGQPTTPATVNTENWERNDRNYVFGAIYTDHFPSVNQSLGAGVANSTVQSAIIVPGVNMGYNVLAVSVFLTNIDSTSGDSFNLCVGVGSYTSGSATLGSNDNSRTAPVVGSTNQGQGVCTNIATVGTTVFGSDVAFSATNFPAGGLTAALGNAPGLLNNAAGTALTPSNQSVVLAASSADYWNTFIPPNYDVVYPAGIPLTLRCTTNASTGSISGLQVYVTLRLVTLKTRFSDPQQSATGTNVYAATPGWSF